MILEQQELPVPQVKQVPKAIPEILEQPEKLALRVTLEILVKQVLREMLVILVKKVILALQVLRETLEIPVQPDRLILQAR